MPEDIRLPDYAVDGVPRSEAQSAQRNTREFSLLSRREHTAAARGSEVPFWVTSCKAGQLQCLSTQLALNIACGL